MFISKHSNVRRLEIQVKGCESHHSTTSVIYIYIYLRKCWPVKLEPLCRSLDRDKKVQNFLCLTWCRKQRKIHSSFQAISFFRLDMYDTVKMKILKNNKTYSLAYQLIYSCAEIRKHGKIQWLYFIATSTTIHKIKHFLKTDSIMDQKILFFGVYEYLLFSLKYF